ncbi:ABC transporter permease [Parapedobacter lycopersici]|uniref:ABC transporter permease n=1 Tax=Parapedobacter lycopersici TaxID=1864939 RepID=UPI00214D866D|nr:FtsX-like permease family protein [Parapedobacter lycopersici]
MNFPYFVAKRITVTGKRTFSKLIVQVAIGAIALGVAAMLLSIAVLKGFKGEVTAKQRGFFGDITLSKYDLNASYESSPFHLRADLATELTDISGISSIHYYATKAGIINVNEEVEGVLLKGIDTTYDQRYIARMLVSGKPIDFSDSTRAANQVLISKFIADRLQLQVGDDFIMYFVQEPIRRRKFVIAGIYNTGVEELDQVYIIGSLPLIRRLNNWNADDVGGYELSIANFDRLQQLTAVVQDRLPIDVQAVSVREQLPQIFQWLDLLDVNTVVILILMMVVAVVNMISALLIIILERTAMIGIFKALGYTNGGIRRIFLYNAAYLIGIGLLLGNILGLGLYFFQDYTHYFKLDEASYYVSYVPVDIDAFEVVALNLGIAAIALLVLLIPSYLISRISPIKAIQFR